MLLECALLARRHERADLARVGAGAYEAEGGHVLAWCSPRRVCVRVCMRWGVTAWGVVSALGSALGRGQTEVAPATHDATRGRGAGTRRPTHGASSSQTQIRSPASPCTAPRAPSGTRSRPAGPWLRCTAGCLSRRGPCDWAGKPDSLVGLCWRGWRGLQVVRVNHTAVCVHRGLPLAWGSVRLRLRWRRLAQACGWVGCGGVVVWRGRLARVMATHMLVIVSVAD